MRLRTDDHEADAALAAEALALLAAVPVPAPKTDAAALLRRFRFLERAQERSRSEERAARPLHAGYALAATLLVAVTALPQLASLHGADDPAAAAVVGALVHLLAWPAALLGGALVLAAGILWADA